MSAFLTTSMPVIRRLFAVAALTVLSAHRGAAQFGGVDVLQDTVVLSDAQPTAPITLRNTGAKPIDVWLDPACAAELDSAEHGDPLADAWHNHSPCAAPWLSDYPQHLVLTPGEWRTIIVRMIPPVTLPNGHYTTRLIYAYFAANTTPTGDTTAVGVLHDEVHTPSPSQS